IDLRLFLVWYLDAGQAALIIDWDCGPVLNRPAYVVNIDVFAEDRWRIHVVLLDRCSGEPDEGRVRESVAKIFREAIGNFAGLLFNPCPESVLASVRFVGNHYDISTIGKHGISPDGAAFPPGSVHLPHWVENEWLKQF